MKLRYLSIAVLATLAALLVVPTGSSALIQNFDVKAAKKVDGNYKDGPTNASVQSGEAKLFFWRVENLSASDRSMIFDDAATDDSGGDDYTIKWFKGKQPKASRNISHDVQTSGFEFTLKAERRKFFTAKVKAKPGAGILCLGGQAHDDPVTTSDASYFFVNGPCT